MRTLYMTAYVAAIIVMAICMLSTYRSEKQIASLVRRFMTSVILAIGANIVLLHSNERGVCMVVYSVYSTIEDWMLYYLLAFSIVYAGYKVEQYVRKRLMGLLLGLDSLSLMLNIWFGHVFALREITLADGGSYYRLIPHFAYNIHLVITYSLILFTVIALFYKSYTASSFYRMKYLMVLIILLVLIALNVYYLVMDESIDLSILFYAIAGISIYYYALLYTPKELLNRTLMLVAHDMMDALLILDTDSICIYANEMADQLLGIKTGDWPNRDGRYQEWTDCLDRQGKKNFVRDVPVKIEGKEMEMRVQAHRLEDNNRRYMGSFFIVRDRTSEAKAQREELYRASHDSLTGLYNKEYFYEKVEKCIREHPDETYLMVCSDIRNFKLVNDLFGTKTGDELLIWMAHVLRKNTIPGEVYGRLRNDRFALLMKKSDFREEIFDDGIENMENLVRGASYPLKIYIGVYEIVTPFIPVSVMCDRAIMALKTIKGSYQKKVAFYNEELRDAVQRERELSGDLQDALEKKQFRIFLQPQVSADGRICGAEAVVRWFHPQKGMIMPEEFIRIFENNGTIAKLDRYVWELALSQLRTWREQGKTDFYISVNISSRDFYFMDVYGTLMELTRQYEVPPKNLRLEITENAVIINPERQIELIRKLRNAGFVMVVDDFGSGYSSINLLEEMKADVLKVNIHRFQGEDQKDDYRRILPTLVTMSDQLKLQVMAERVETEEQIEYLKEQGVNMFQGYYFAKPMEVSQFEETYMQTGDNF